jgi:hypothetical protein
MYKVDILLNIVKATPTNNGIFKILFPLTKLELI